MALIGGATLNQTPLDWKHNTSNIIAAIKYAKEAGVKVLCLPELCITGYGCEDMFLSDWVYDQAERELTEIIPYCDQIFVAIGVPVKHEGKNYNCAAIIHNRKLLGIVAKQNLANDGVHYEPRWFTAWKSSVVEDHTLNGDRVPFGDLTFEVEGFKVGFEICEDAWRNERPACRLFEQKVNLILNLSASHFAFGKSSLRHELVVTSSKNFECTYVYANLLGNEAGRMIYDGETMIASHGKLYAYNELMSFQDFNLTMLDINPGGETKSPELPPYVEDKNIIFSKSAPLGLFDYVRKSRSNGFVLSLSGGADSTTCAILVHQMAVQAFEELGIENALQKLGFDKGTKISSPEELLSYYLTTAYQGTVNSSAETLAAAQEIANEIGAVFYKWTIDQQVQSYSQTIEKAINRQLTWERDDITLQNIQARARSPIIWMLANINNALLLTTSNRSEGDVGYATMDGDTSGSLAPIAAVDKAFIVSWLKWAEANLGYKSLRHVNALKPTAELRPLGQAQTDEKDLMPYPLLVEIEKLAIRNKKSPKEVFAQLSTCNEYPAEQLKMYIKKFFWMWSRNQWKRERIAPAFHLDDFNVDPRTWCRFPILSSGFKQELEEL